MNPSKMPAIEGFWYVGTPYSRFPDGITTAFAAACKSTAALVRAGVPVFSPIAHSHPVALYGGLDPLDHAIWLPADAPLMKAAGGLIVVMLPSWRESVGLRHEIEAFEAADKPVIYWAGVDA